MDTSVLQLKSQDLTSLKTNMAKPQKKARWLMPGSKVIDLEHVLHEMKVLGQLETVLEILSIVPSDLLKHSAGDVFKHFVGRDSPIESFKTLVNNKHHKLDIPISVNVAQQHIME